MDPISHLLIGKLLTAYESSPAADAAAIILFSFLPDLFQIPLYLRLGRERGRKLWIPADADWRGYRSSRWALWWEIPHSILFAVLVVAPIVLLLGLTPLAIVAYLLHIIVDIPTHRGEWAVRPFFPFKYKVQGFTDAWRWSWGKMAVAWVALALMLLL
jgi:membrane-bound metal-dependent hydrolase YbcI (DUF457 family)